MATARVENLLTDHWGTDQMILTRWRNAGYTVDPLREIGAEHVRVTMVVYAAPRKRIGPAA